MKLSQTTQAPFINATYNFSYPKKSQNNLLPGQFICPTTLKKDPSHIISMQGLSTQDLMLT